MRRLVIGTPCSDCIATVATLELDLCIVAHGAKQVEVLYRLSRGLDCWALVPREIRSLSKWKWYSMKGRLL